MFNHDCTRAALEQVTQAIYHHEQWHQDVTRIIVCRLPYEDCLTSEDAHRKCRFGKWYYSEASQALSQYEAFVAVESAHTHMHELATRLLCASTAHDAVSPCDYDNFAKSLDRLRLHLSTLKQEIEDSLYRRDPLTGAENRVDMLTKLRESLAMVKRGIQPCSITLMDLDHFKSINDDYGHMIGDQVLATLVCRAKESLRAYDRIFRYGGEEFLISMPDTTAKTARKAMERVRKHLSSSPLFQHEGAPLFVTASFGIAQLDPSLTVEDSINRADKALYDAKKAGRNCVRIWDA